MCPCHKCQRFGVNLVEVAPEMHEEADVGCRHSRTGMLVKTWPLKFLFPPQKARLVAKLMFPCKMSVLFLKSSSFNWKAKKNQTGNEKIWAGKH